MVAERVSMRKVLEVLRLKFDCRKGERPIAHSVGIGRTTVSDYLARFAASGLSWPLPAGMDEEQLEAKLFPPKSGSSVRAMPDFAVIDVELRKPGVTLALLWTEYKQERGEQGYQFSRFCELHSEWRKKQRLWMKQHHKAGEKLFVDFSGDKLKLVDPQTGEVVAVKLFVAAMGASSYTFAYAVRDETMASFLECHVRAFEFFQGVPEVVVPDNLRSAVTRPDRYEPELNRSYLDLAEHYGVCVIPARPRKPRDKAVVEVAVQVAQRWIMAVLRNHTFYSLDDLNEAIEQLVEKLNARTMRHLGRSRKELFQELDRPVLKPLPVNRYEFARWQKAKVHPDYHVDLDRHFYSVPFQYRGEEVWIRSTLRMVEVMLKGRRIASHAFSQRKWGYSTLPEHMPPAHLHVANSTVEEVKRRASQLGTYVAEYVDALMARREHPEQAVKSCMGMLRLVRDFGPQRLDAACQRACRFQAFDVKSIKNILAHGLDRQPLESPPVPALPLHENIRGSTYYH